MSWSQFADIFGKIVGPIFGTVAAISGAVAAWSAYHTLKERREAERPYIFMGKSGIDPLSQSLQKGQYHIEVIIENVGFRPAFDLYARLYLVDGDLKHEPQQIADFSFAEIVRGIPMTWYTNTLKLQTNVPLSYFVLAVRYRDPRVKETLTQTFFKRWAGLENGEPKKLSSTQEPQRDFVEATLEEKGKIEDHLRYLLRGFFHAS